MFLILLKSESFNLMGRCVIQFSRNRSPLLNMILLTPLADAFSILCPVEATLSSVESLFVFIPCTQTW